MLVPKMKLLFEYSFSTALYKLHLMIIHFIFYLFFAVARALIWAYISNPVGANTPDSITHWVLHSKEEECDIPDNNHEIFLWLAGV